MAQHPAAPQDPDWDANLDFLLGDLGCMPTVDTALHTALPATHATSTAPAAQHAALPGTAPQTKSAPTLCPVSTLTNSANTGRDSPVKAGLLDYYLPDFKYEGVETQSFRRPWKSARSKGPSSVLSSAVLLSHFVSTHAHTSGNATQGAHGTLHDTLHGTLHDTLHNTLPGTPHCTTVILAILFIALTAMIARAYTCLLYTSPSPRD